jgi:hypothetical protein
LQTVAGLREENASLKKMLEDLNPAEFEKKFPPPAEKKVMLSFGFLTHSGFWFHIANATIQVH